MREPSIFSLNPETYQRSPLHEASRAFPESNCYIDVFIELLHALGCDVHACLGFTLGTVFEGDQWTFYKPRATEMQQLYDVDVQELTLWRPLVEHAAEQLSRGRIAIPEIDAFYLPDVAGTDYQTAHVKTTIAIVKLDIPGKRLGYFHNCSYHQLSGADFDGVFRLKAPNPPDYLPPFCEFMKFDKVGSKPADEVVEASLNLARSHLARRSPANPMLEYLARLERDLVWLVQQEQSTFHSYVFATLRQCGSSFEFAGLHLQWLQAKRGLDLTEAAEQFLAITGICKMLILKLARVARSKKVADFSEPVRAMAQHWERGMELTAARLSV